MRRNARRHGAKPAVICNERSISWAQCDERANRVANALKARKIERGDRVAVCARNCIEWPEIVFGLAKAGFVLVPINTRLALDEVEYAVTSTGVRAAIVHTDSVAGLGGAFIDLDAIVEIDGSELGEPYDQVIQRADVSDPTPDDLTPDQLRLLLLTSGTTGRPRAAMHSHSNMISSAVDHLLVTGGREDDVCLAATPFFTAGGMMRTLFWSYLGQTMVVLEKFDAEEFLALVEHHRVTTSILVPTMLQRVVAAQQADPTTDLSSLRILGYGSAPVPPDLAESALNTLCKSLFQQYGLTEAGGLVTILDAADHQNAVQGEPSLLQSCGRETPQVEIEVVNEDGVSVATGEVGEIVIRSSSLATGYWQEQEAWERTFKDRRLWTGDLAYRDDKGYLYVVDRRNDMILSGAFNVYPGEIERVLMSHHEVRLAAVIGVPDDQWGERPFAFVVAEGGVEPADLIDELLSRCRRELAGYKQPQSIELLPELPLTAAGKVLRRQLREPFWSGKSKQV